MKYFIFKAPYKNGDKPLEELNFYPADYLIGHKAAKYGPIQILSEEDIAQKEVKYL